MGKKIDISAVIVAKDESVKLPDCLKSLEWVDEIVLVDNSSVDNTVKTAKCYGAKIYSYRKGNFSERKNFAAGKASGRWLLFVDADERVTTSLKEEITSITKNKNFKENDFTGAIPRRNYIFGKEFKHSNQYPDYVVRFFKKNSFKEWKGDLHEQPYYVGKLSYLNNPFIHLKHKKIEEMMEKTNKWSEVEARLMVENNHPKMNILRFFSAVYREFYLRFIKQKAYLDGVEGIIYALYQVFSRFLSYGKLWEMQTQFDGKR